jgi:uncharacterized protein (TIRG00374 family)
MRRWQFWLGVLISVGFLYFSLRGLRLGDMWAVVRSANYWWLIPGVAIYFLAVVARTWRWHYLLRPLKNVPLRRLFPIVAIGYMGNNIYPARAGEVLRAYILRRKDGIPFTASFATIVVERVFDGVVMLLFVFVNLPELANLTAASGFVGSIRELALLGTAAFVGALFVFLLAAMFPRRTMAVVEWMIARIVLQTWRPRVAPIAARFLEGLTSLRSPRDALMVFITSVVLWLLETGKYWFVMHAFPFEVSFFALMLMNGIVNLATSIPSAPGYVGTFDAPGIALLQAYRVPQALAAGYTLVLHAALWLPITLVGAWYMARESLSWASVQAEVGRESKPTGTSAKPSS